MEIDTDSHVKEVDRSVVLLKRDGKPAGLVRLSRSYPTTVEDLWDAVTDGDRIGRWFAPVSGQFEIGGRFQIEGNAGGTITVCEAPSRLAVTWEFGGDVSWVTLRVSNGGPDSATLVLEHEALVSDHWNTFGPGAVGVGWEAGLMGLSMHIRNPAADRPDPEAAWGVLIAKGFIALSCEKWGEAAIAAGSDPQWARKAAESTRAFYSGEST